MTVSGFKRGDCVRTAAGRAGVVTSTFANGTKVRVRVDGVVATYRASALRWERPQV